MWRLDRWLENTTRDGRDGEDGGEQVRKGPPSPGHPERPDEETNVEAAVMQNTTQPNRLPHRPRLMFGIGRVDLESTIASGRINSLVVMMPKNEDDPAKIATAVP